EQLEGRRPPHEPRYSRKTKRWTLVAGGRKWTVPGVALEGALRHVASLLETDSDLPACPSLTKLFDQLLLASLLTRQGKPRGRNAAKGQAVFKATVRYAAAVAYVFALAELKKEKQRHHSKIQELETVLVANDVGYSSAGRQERSFVLARRLVFQRFPRASWRRVGLRPPTLETFIRHYVKTGSLAVIRGIANRTPGFLSGEPGAQPKSAYLRHMLGPFGTV